MGLVSILWVVNRFIFILFWFVGSILPIRSPGSYSMDHSPPPPLPKPIPLRLAEIKPLAVAGDPTSVNVTVISMTPNAEAILLYAARVSSVEQNSGKSGLINYLLREKHLSPFEMPDVIVEINGFPRTIVRQAVRHKSNEWRAYDIEEAKIVESPNEGDEFPFFHTPGTSVQEHSYRYSTGKLLGAPKSLITHTRLQHPTDRQASLYLSDPFIQKYYPKLTPEDSAATNTLWLKIQEEVIDFTYERYQYCLNLNIANESARNLLPEGLTPTKLIVKFNLRSLITFQMDRNYNFGSGNTAQKEIQYLAHLLFRCIEKVLPIVAKDMMSYSLRSHDASTTVTKLTNLYTKGKLTDEELKKYLTPTEKVYVDVPNPFVERVNSH